MTLSNCEKVTREITVHGDEFEYYPDGGVSITHKRLDRRDGSWIEYIEFEHDRAIAGTRYDCPMCDCLGTWSAFAAKRVLRGSK